MSIRHLTAVWEDGYYQQGDKAKLLVALAIADCARAEDGRAWPSIEYLARKARTSIRGVQEACRELEQHGRLQVLTNAGPNGTNLYKMIDTPPQPLHPPRNEAPEKAAEMPAEKAAADCTQTVKNRQEPEKEPEVTSLGSAVSERGLKFADWFKTTLPGDAKLSGTWRDQWAKCFDDMLRLDSRTPEQVAAVCKWARGDDFWKANFQTPLKLRQRKATGHPTYFDVFAERMKSERDGGGRRGESAADRNARSEAKQYAAAPGATPTFDPMAAAV